MTGVLQGLALGLVVGAIFGVFRLTPPAPASWAGVAGIVGIVAGWLLVGWLLQRVHA